MNNSDSKFREWVFVMWRPILIFIGLTLVVSFLFGFKLGNLTPSASEPEISYINSVSSGSELLKNPVYFVHKLPVYVLFKLDVNSLAAYRAISAFFAGLAIVSCFFILREWYTNKIALLGSGLFLSSAWILHTGRLATPESSYLLLMPLVWAAVWLYFTTFRKTALFVLSFLCAASIYIPGFAWLLLFTIIWQHKRIWEEIQYVPWWFRTFCMLIIVGGLIPLLWASVSTPSILLLASGLPEHLPSLRSLFENFIHIPENLFLRGPDDPVRWVGRLPLLDVFSTAMFFLGIYSIRYSLKQHKIQILTGSSIFFILLITTGGALTITVLMPAIYILIAGGMAFLLQQWFTVFPRNPLAHTLATSLISISVLLACFYHINHYFIAWPQTPATKSSFRHSLVK